MGKRKLELKPGEISLNFKRNKYDNANGIIELLLRVETATNRELVDCITSLTEIAISIIKAGDSAKPALQKPDDLKNAADKYKEWMQMRYMDIIRKFYKLLLHKKSTVSERAMTSLLSIIRQQARTEESFPLGIYTKAIKTLLSSSVDCRKVIRCLKEPLLHHDMAVYTLKVVSKMVVRRSDHTAPLYKVNLVSLALLLTVPPKVNRAGGSSPLWCSSRRVRKKKLASTVEKRKQTVSVKKQRKDSKKSKLMERSKGKYKEAIMQQTADDQDKKEEDVPSEDDKDMMEEESDLEELDNDDEEAPEQQLDSDEEQRRQDDNEFKAAQKVKKQRKSTRLGIEDVPEPDNDDEDLDCQQFLKKIKMPTYKPVAAKDRLLPLGAFNIKSLFEVEQKPNDSNETEDALEIPDGNDSDSDEEDEDANQGPRYKHDYKLACKFLTIIWEKIMSYTLTEELYKRCLVFIPDQVMEHLNNPVKLTDFFITSYNCGGGVSLMAMHGVFLLMNKHNLQYPDFYPKVYSLLEPSVFHARYKPRFFLLLDIFLSSTHLPEYIAAAFIKRLARLSLYAPANCTLLVVKSIKNLLARFPSLNVLYNYEEDSNVDCDPYDVTKTDLMLSRASDSSLWELATLNKSAPELLYKATLFIKNITQLEEVDISSHLETEYEELDPTVEENAENIKKTSSNFKPVEKLFNDPESNFNLLFGGVC